MEYLFEGLVNKIGIIPASKESVALALMCLVTTL
jgi:hypothetical protein